MLKEVAESYLMKIKASTTKDGQKSQIISIQHDEDLIDSYRVIVEYLSAMRMLLAYDVDNIEECVSGFEKFVDQIMIYFTDTFKDWANASDIQYLILNIVRSGFQIKILL